LPAFKPVIRDNRTPVCYHGTSIEKAEVILSSGQFIPSKNDYDWLGHGVYFWENAPLRAFQWAKQRYRDRGVVIEANVALGFCLDLTDSRYTSALKQAYERLRDAYLESSLPLPINKNKANYLDCLVINYLTTYILPECDTVRAAFLEGDPIYSGSMLRAQSHIQIVVRNMTCIKNPIKLIPSEEIDELEI
jgi:hypothetical protein